MAHILSFQHALQRHHDVIIVGAGPAGTAAATELARRGISVLLMDRAAAFPREKACGDAIPPAALDELQGMGILEQVREKGRQVSRISVQFSEQSSYGAGAGVREVLNHLVVPRKEFDAILWKHAVSFSACSWLPSVTALSFSYDGADILLRTRTASGEEGELRARVVIAADGSRSRLARQLRKWHFEQSSLDAQAIMPPGQWTQQLDGTTHFTAMRGYCRAQGPLEHFEFVFPASSEVYYYWAFPVSTTVWNVGLIARLKESRAGRLDFASTLTTWLASHTKQAKQEIRLESLLAAPIDGGLRDAALYGRQIVCVGDAAALADTTLGGGISDALWSGKAAAQAIATWLEQAAELSDYGKKVWERYLLPYYLSSSSRDPRDQSFWLSSSLQGAI